MRLEPIATFKMRTRAARTYGVRAVSDEFNVSSSGHWHFYVTLKWRGGIRRGWYDALDTHILFPVRDGRSTMPKIPTKYLYRELNDEIAKALAGGKMRPFEYNRDGYKRYDNLRYIGISGDIKHEMWEEAHRVWRGIGAVPF